MSSKRLAYILFAVTNHVEKMFAQSGRCWLVFGLELDANHFETRTEQHLQMAERKRWHNELN